MKHAAQPYDFPPLIDNPREDADLAVSLLDSVCELHPSITAPQRLVLRAAQQVLKRLAE